METQFKLLHTISASAEIAAPAERIYALIADYRTGHPSILPPQFSNLVVEKGGVGAGTIIRFNMKVFGRTQTYRAAITEPAPGRVLVETDLDANGAVTSFIHDPGAALGPTRVTIKTELPVRRGFLGIIERYLSTKLLHPIYTQELQILAERVTESPIR